MIRIMIADDHKLFREGLTLLLETTPDIEVIAAVETGLEAVEKARELEPDVILMDIMMPDVNGIQATRQIMKHTSTVGIVMLTMLEDEDSLFAAMCAGARGYILKGADKTEVLDTIRAVADGSALFGADIARRLTDFFQRIEASPQRSDIAFPELTDREREVLNLIAKGFANQDIATALFISPKTVSNYVSSIFNKLQVADRAQAIVKARERGLGQDE